MQLWKSMFFWGFYLYGNFSCPNSKWKRNYLQIIHILWPGEHERQYIQDVCSSEIMDNSFFLLYHFLYFPNTLQLENGFSFFNKTKEFMPKTGWAPNSKLTFRQMAGSCLQLAFMLYSWSLTIYGSFVGGTVCRPCIILFRESFLIFLCYTCWGKGGSDTSLERVCKASRERLLTLTPAKNNNHFCP